jgi:hypothetical protein
MNDWDEVFRSSNKGSNFFTKYETKYKQCVNIDCLTLPIAAAYNAGFDEGYLKARNELWHILQMKNG